LSKPLKLEDIKVTLEKIGADFTLQISGVGKVDLSIDIENLPEGLRANAQAEISKSFIAIWEFTRYCSKARSSLRKKTLFVAETFLYYST
jgi:hypothetical protein